MNTVEARAAERARLVLMAADGASNRDLGAVIGMHYNQVAVWRRRYAQFGLASLAVRRAQRSAAGCTTTTTSCCWSRR